MRNGMTLRPASVLLAAVSVVCATEPAQAQLSGPLATKSAKHVAAGEVRYTAADSPELPPDYFIGPDDVLSIMFWREKDLTADVTVRADGMISIPLLNDVRAAGLTPAQLKLQLEGKAERYVAEPNATVVVKQINSRKVFITGMVEKPGAYPLLGPMTAMQLIATAGGFREFAKTKNIVIVRQVDRQQTIHHFNYEDFVRWGATQQNIELKPGDTVIVR